MNLKNNLFLFIFVFIFFACNNKSESLYYCEGTSFRKQSYCYRWIGVQDTGQRIMIYEQLTYDEQIEPLLVLDAFFSWPNKQKISFEYFVKNLSAYLPPNAQVPDSLDNPAPHILLLSCDTCTVSDELIATKVYYEPYCP